MNESSRIAVYHLHDAAECVAQHRFEDAEWHAAQAIEQIRLLSTEGDVEDEIPTEGSALTS